MLKQWAARYRGFVQRRFNTFSKGGGDWKPLAASTVRQRRKGRSKGKPAILRDTGAMYAALTPTFVGAPGAVERRDALSVTVGFGGPGRHPGGQATVADIASFHDLGRGVPQRKIIVPPSQEVLDAMSMDAERALEKLAKDV